MSGKEEGITTAASSFSVEVVASLSDEKNMSFSLLKKASGLSLVDQCEPGEQESGPALVRVGSNSESDNSSVASSETDENYQVVEPFELSSPHVEVQTGVKTAVVPKEEDGMYDCLSDHFSNLFCPVEQEALPPSTTEVAKTDTQAIVSCTDVACTEVACTTTSCTALQFFDIINANPGADMLSSLQDWLAPSQEESRNSELQKPQNRSCSTKRKSAYTRRLWNNWYPENGIPIERSESMPEAPTPSIQDLHFDVFYDSDPEQEHKDRKTRAESLIRRQNYKDRSPSSIHTLFYDGMDSSSSFDNYKLCPPTPRNSELQQTFDFKSRSCSYSYETPVNGASMDTPLFFDSPVALTEFDLLHPDGDEMLKRFCQEVTNARIQLVWHRHQLQAPADKTPAVPCARAPVAVTGAFEVGAHLDNLVVQPKFTWSPTNEPNLQKRKIRLSGREPDSIELLSIVRVTTSIQLDRTLYPFARLDRTCCITTNDERYPNLIFEAGSERERDWLVTALKIIVARLASIIIVRDENMLLEFFSPYSALTSLADGDYEEDHEPCLEPNGELQLISYTEK